MNFDLPAGVPFDDNLSLEQILELLIEENLFQSKSIEPIYQAQAHELTAPQSIPCPLTTPSVSTELEQVQPTETTSNKRSKRKRDTKKNQFLEEMTEALSQNLENPSFVVRKCTKYSPKSTPYDHLKNTITFQ